MKHHLLTFLALLLAYSLSGAQERQTITAPGFKPLTVKL